MKECPGCGAALLDSASVCNECGSRWEVDGAFVPGPHVDEARPAEPLSGSAGRDVRDYEWVGDLAYLDAAGGPGFGPFVILGFVVGCVVAFWQAVVETVRAGRAR